MPLLGALMIVIRPVAKGDVALTVSRLLVAIVDPRSHKSAHQLNQRELFGSSDILGFVYIQGLDGISAVS
jgi:hypothetical protein